MWKESCASLQSCNVFSPFFVFKEWSRVTSFQNPSRTCHKSKSSANLFNRLVFPCKKSLPLKQFFFPENGFCLPLLTNG